ncbi:MAG: MazE family transcriptional regulator [Cyclonatronaceae bacterium]
MIKKIQKIGNSQGIILEKALLKLIKADKDDHLEVVPREDGLLLRRSDIRSVYNEISKRHRKSLDKLAK